MIIKWFTESLGGWRELTVGKVSREDSQGHATEPDMGDTAVAITTNPPFQSRGSLCSSPMLDHAASVAVGISKTRAVPYIQLHTQVAHKQIWLVKTKLNPDHQLQGLLRNVFLNF